jgi:hypothetical protein
MGTKPRGEPERIVWMRQIRLFRWSIIVKIYAFDKKEGIRNARKR